MPRGRGYRTLSPDQGRMRLSAYVVRWGSIAAIDGDCHQGNCTRDPESLTCLSSSELQNRGSDDAAIQAAARGLGGCAGSAFVFGFSDDDGCARSAFVFGFSDDWVPGTPCLTRAGCRCAPGMSRPEQRGGGWPKVSRYRTGPLPSLWTRPSYSGFIGIQNRLSSDIGREFVRDAPESGR